MTTTLELDLDQPFEAALFAATLRHGQGASTIPLEGPCRRAVASNRLHVRRMALGSPGSGLPGAEPSWSYLDHQELIPAELERMGVEAGPCDDPACWVCHPQTCPTCGGTVGGSCEAANLERRSNEENQGG